MKGPVLEASDSISLFEGSASDHSHFSPLRTDAFSTDGFFGTKCLIWLTSSVGTRCSPRIRPLPEFPGSAGESCVYQKHHVPGGLGYPDLAVYGIHMMFLKVVLNNMYGEFTCIAS